MDVAPCVLEDRGGSRGVHVLSNPSFDAGAEEGRMSASIAHPSQDASNTAIASEHSSSAHSHHLDALANRSTLTIESLVPQSRARCLDLGRGDTTLADAVQARASRRTDWRCIDAQRMPTDFLKPARSANTDDYTIP